MAQRTVCGEVRLHVVGIRRAVIVLHVALIAGTTCQLVVVVDVTLRALQIRVPSGQRETNGVVIKAGGLPGAGAVARLTGLGECQRHVVRIIGLLVVRQMAPDTGSRRVLELIVDVTGRAVESCVRSGQGVAGVLEVVEPNPKPIVEAVALFARGGKAGDDVSGAGGCLKFLGMAGITRSRKSLELSDGRALVAGIAVKRRVSTHEWKPVLMVLDLPDRDLPSPYCMALFAGRPQLPLMDIGMAIGAPAPDITEHQFAMTLRARDALVHAAERVAGLIVVEFRNAADGLPCSECVAVLARNV